MREGEKIGSALALTKTTKNRMASKTIIRGIGPRPEPYPSLTASEARSAVGRWWRSVRERRWQVVSPVWQPMALRGGSTPLSWHRYIAVEELYSQYKRDGGDLDLTFNQFKQYFGGHEPSLKKVTMLVRITGSGGRASKRSMRFYEFEALK